MSDERTPSTSDGALSPAEGAGTPAAVDVSGDLRKRWIWALFVVGPVVWLGHFMLVYLVAEAGCTGGGPGLRVLDPPVPVLVTLVTTVLAVGGCIAAAVWAFRHWRTASHIPDVAPDLAGEHDDDGRRGALAFSAFLLSTFSVVAVLFTGAPALVLGPC